MKLLLVVTLFVSSVFALPSGRKLRPEEHWRPASPKDISKFQPRSLLFPRAKSDAKVLRKSIPKPSAYDLAAECGIEGPPAKNKIVGGTEAAPNQWPWAVAIFIDNSWFCGGSLISEQWVLTAAHCVDGGSYFNIAAGAHNIRDHSEPHRIEIVSYNGFTHENWNPQRLLNDIALIELPQPITFNDYIKPACLPAMGNAANPGEMASVIGWGKPSDAAGGISPVLRMVHDRPIISNAQCKQFFGQIPEGVVCIDTTGGHSSCNGDSGGPLIQKDMFKYPGNKWTQAGIVSFGARTCETNAPAAFTRTEFYLTWIQQNTGIRY